MQECTCGQKEGFRRDGVSASGAASDLYSCDGIQLLRSTRRRATRTNNGRQVLELDERDVGAEQLLLQRPQLVRQLRGAVVDRLCLLPLRARVSRLPQRLPASARVFSRAVSAAPCVGASTVSLAGRQGLVSPTAVPGRTGRAQGRQRVSKVLGLQCLATRASRTALAAPEHGAEAGARLECLAMLHSVPLLDASARARNHHGA